MCGLGQAGVKARAGPTWQQASLRFSHFLRVMELGGNGWAPCKPRLLELQHFLWLRGHSEGDIQ